MLIHLMTNTMNDYGSCATMRSVYTVLAPSFGTRAQIDCGESENALINITTLPVTDKNNSNAHYTEIECDGF